MSVVEESSLKAFEKSISEDTFVKCSPGELSCLILCGGRFHHKKGISDLVPEDIFQKQTDPSLVRGLFALVASSQLVFGGVSKWSSTLEILSRNGFCHDRVFDHTRSMTVVPCFVVAVRGGVCVSIKHSRS